MASSQSLIDDLTRLDVLNGIGECMDKREEKQTTQAMIRDNRNNCC